MLALYEGSWLRVSGETRRGHRPRPACSSAQGGGTFIEGLDVSGLLEHHAALRRRETTRAGRFVMMGTTAVVYSEAFFGTPDGKTANGLVRHSEKYEILSVIDSTKAGLDAGDVARRRPERDPDLRRPRGRRSPWRAASPTSSSSAWRPSAACSPRTSAASCSTRCAAA